MAAPRDKELGVRSPFKWRAGIDFPTWEGVNKQNDPGAIRNSQFQQVMNGRINGNEVVSRGGQSKTYNTGIDGCIYSMIDVQGDLGIFVWDPTGNSGPNPGSYTGINRYGLSSRFYTQAVASPAFDFSANPRRNIIPFQGKLYIFGTDPTTSVTGLWVLSFPSGDDSGSTAEPAKWAGAQDLSDFNSFAIRSELTTNGANQAMYIGTKSSNTVYRWDGLTLTTEATGVGAGPLVMFTFHGEVYAAGTNTLNSRGSLATWTQTYSLGGLGLTSFAPSTAVEYVNQALIAGTDTTAGQRARVLSFDGTTVTMSNDPGTTFSDFTDLVVGSNGLVYWCWHRDLNTTQLTTYNGVTWTNVFFTTVDSQANPGALLALGSDLYWWTCNDCNTKPIGSLSSQTGVVLILFSGFDIPSAEVVVIGSINSGIGLPPPTDMNVLA